MTGVTVRRLAVLLLAGFPLLASLPAVALTISPIMVELSPQKKVASLRVLNDSAEAMTFQAETLSWQQTGSGDQYAQTHELLVAPTIARIEPGATQIFRVMLKGTDSRDTEHAYRLMLEDVTQETATQPGEVKLRFRHNLPLFVTPRQPVVVNSQWRPCAASANKGCVQLENLGNRRVRLSSVAVEGPGWRKEIEGGITVLAGATRKWLFDLKGNQAAALRVIATSDIGEILQAVELPGSTP